MTDTTHTNGSTAATAAVLSPGELGPLADAAVRKAVDAQIGTAARDVAADVVPAMLTPEVLDGMRETAILAVEAILDPPPAPEQPGRTAKFPDVAAFVEGYVRHMYRREVTAPRNMRWCPQWWAHGEVWSRMEALHQAFEHLRLGATTEPAAWWLTYFGPMMQEILATDGPFKYCSVEHGHSDKLVPLPCKPAPPERDAADYEDTHSIPAPGSTTASGIFVPSTPTRRRVIVPEAQPPTFP